MLTRVAEGIPPVSEAEFAELAGWFAEHDASLFACSHPSELLDVGGGRRVSCANVRYALAKGPRADGAGRGPKTFDSSGRGTVTAQRRPTDRP